MNNYFINYCLFFLPLIFCIEIFNKKDTLFRCGADNLKILTKLENSKLLSDKINNLNDIEESSIENAEFKDLSIYLDLFSFEDEIVKYNLTDYRDFFLTGINKALDIIKSLFKVRKVEKEYFISDKFLTEFFGLELWDKEKIGDEAKSKNITLESLGIDLYIFVKFLPQEELGYTILAAAAPGYFDNSTGQPSMGILFLNKDYKYSRGNSLIHLENVVLHELTHVLGFSRFILTYFFPHICFNKTDADGFVRPYLNSTKLLKVAKKYFNCNEIDGVPLEELGGEGSFGSHWEEKIFLGEYMNAAIYPEEQVISEFTLALLEDLGYYKANYYTGGLMQYGKNKGCDFLNKKCIDNRKANPKFKNEYFDKVKNAVFDPACSSGRQSRAYRYLNYHISIPEQFQYFNSSNWGGRKFADYCPVSMESIIESIYTHYVGSCSEFGNGEYGSLIVSTDPIANKNYTKNGEISSITGEINSENSFCVLSSLIHNQFDSFKFLSNTIRAFCYKMFCSDRSLTIQINNDYIVCPRAGGKIKAINYEGYLLCPDYNLICSGTVMCNNMLDCVEKKSLLKDDIVYDYESKTTQDLFDAENDIFSEDSYELSTNGKCPQYCTQCDKDSSCINCNSNYTIVNNKCILKIGNCKKYENDKCSQCEDGYKLDEKSNRCNEKKNKKLLYIIIICSICLIIIIIIIVVILVKTFNTNKDLSDEVYKVSFEQDDNKEKGSHETLLS